MATVVSLIKCILWLSLLLSAHGSMVHGDDKGFQIFRMETLTPANVCTTSQVPNGNSLKLVHRYGPCSPSSYGQPDLVQMLSLDMLRVAYYRNRVRRTIGTPENATTDNLGQGPITLRALHGAFLGGMSYVVTIGIGTHKRDQTVVIDTGSHICWVQCTPCRNCYEQQEPKFNPSTSSSYRNVPFTAPQCANLQSGNRGASGNNCAYHITYGNNSSRSAGLIATETLTLTNTTTFPNFVLGCGQSNEIPIRAAGIFGLGRTYPSLISQAPSSLGRVFSYCLPTTSSVSGHLTIGRRFVQSPMYTPMQPSRSLDLTMYFINLLGITVGRQRLHVPPTVFQNVGTIIDSGTTFSYLPPVAYAELRNTIRSSMRQYRLVVPSQDLDTCYDLSNVRNPAFPTITLHFADSANLVLKPWQVFVSMNEAHSQVCLAFVPNDRTDDVGIIGNNQQRGIDITFDIGLRRVGFAAGNCS